MAHMLEKMCWYGQIPWHGLGQELRKDQIFNLEECFQAAGLDWEVERQPIFLANKEDISHLGQAIVRKTDKSTLAIVGPKFTPLQNKDSFEFFRPFLEEKLASINAAGSLDSGRKIWVLAKLTLTNSVVTKDDEIEKFILLSNSHDGTLAVRAGFTPVRCVCWNTLCMAHGSKASRLIRIRHSKDVKKRVEDLREIMNLANQEFEATIDQYKLLAHKTYNQKDIKKFVHKMFNIYDTPVDEISTKTKNQMDRVFTLIESGRGNTLPSVKHTMWAMYNGYSEYLQYERGHNLDTRLNSLWFGDSAKRLKNALELCLQMAA